MNTLPNGWERKKLGDLFEVQLGKMLNKDAKNKYPQYRYLGNSSIRWGSIDTSNLQTMYFSEKEKEKFKLINGDILLCEGGDVGRCAIWDKNEKMYYQKALHRLRSKGKIISQFFQNYMLYFSSTKEFENYITKTSIAHLTREKLINIEIKVPPLLEQTKIANILSTWDKAIQTTEQLLANSQQQKKALMQQLLTGKKRLKGFSGEWKKGVLSDVANITKGKALTAKELSAGEYPVIAGGKTSPYNHSKFTHENVITVSASGAYAGFVSYHPYKIWASDCSVIEAKEKNHLYFIYKILELLQNKIYSLQSGGAQPHIYPKDLELLKLTYPNIDEQQKIAQILSTQDHEIDTLQQKLACLKQEKKALMQKLLSGKVRVA